MSTDYRKFLKQEQEMVLPYLGGPTIRATDRRLRVTQPGEPGWWKVRVSGRKASLAEPTEAPSLDELPKVRGHWAEGMIFSTGKDAERVDLCLEEPASLAPCIARRWPGGELLFENVDFEDEAEDNARRALEDQQDISHLKGVSPALRAAFGCALGANLARRRGVRVSPLELRAHWAAIAEGGIAQAQLALDGILEARRLAELQVATREATRRRQARIRARPEDVWDQVVSALQGTGAEPLSTRVQRGQHGRSNVEVTFRFMGERFISVVDLETFQVWDSGVCLDGADAMVTLDSLPGVLREAIDTDQLVITRHA